MSGNDRSGRSAPVAENRRMHPLPRPRQRGFTLIELMVAVAIVGILAAVAYPSYTSFIQRSRRADAAAVITMVVQAQERYRSNRNAYASELSDLGLTSANLAKIAKNYSVSLSGAGASGYQVTATVKRDGSQANDTACWTLGVKLEGANLSYLAADESATKDQSAICWPR